MEISFIIVGDGWFHSWWRTWFLVLRGCPFLGILLEKISFLLEQFGVLLEQFGVLLEKFSFLLEKFSFLLEKSSFSLKKCSFCWKSLAFCWKSLVSVVKSMVGDWTCVKSNCWNGMGKSLMGSDICQKDWWFWCDILKPVIASKGQKRWHQILGFV